MATSQSRATTFQSIEVEAVGEDEYVSKVLWQGEDSFKLRGAYGGQVIAQALMAACHTVTDAELLLHSAHCYFMSPVQISLPVTYRVARTKDGRVFSMRAIQALQGGKVLVQCLTSFKRPESDPPVLSHSPAGIPPGFFPPDDPRLDTLSKEKMLFNHKPPLASLPFDYYYCFRGSDQERLLAKEPLEPKVFSWMKLSGSLPATSSQNTHRVALAFLSDFSMVFPVRLKYPEFTPSLSTSLDHSLWFHSSVQWAADQWLLQSVECIQAGGGTSLNCSHIYSEDGTLLATCLQQAFFRSTAKL